MKRAIVERIIAQSARIIKELEQVVVETGEGEFDDLLSLMGRTRSDSIQVVEEEIAIFRSNIVGWERVMQEHSDLFH